MPTLEQARQLYPDQDPVHGWDHILRVYHMAERLAIAEGADLEIVHAAALLHDSKGSDPNSGERLSHHEASAIFAATVLKEEGWEEERIVAVQQCIRGHRYRGGQENQPQTIEAMVIFDADKLDVLGAIGVARTIGYAVQDGQPIYAEPSRQFLETGVKVEGEPHSSYHEFLFKLRKVKSRLFTASARGIAESRHQYLTGFYEQLKAEIAAER
ncbi:MAG: HD domain-containing protein [Chloroflexi bacterium HGW-Chloroflexi-8]|nr:MAG: HD domain-containing protein [Chloroflexi bacterium HGW-Chloroflexi-8]